jgi:hypothetical protein
MYVDDRSCAKTPLSFFDTAQTHARRVNAPKYVTLKMTLFYTAQNQPIKIDRFRRDMIFKCNQ